MSKTIFSLGRLELVWRTQDTALQRIQSQFSRKERPAIYDAASNWYEGWYFALRLDEEIVRSRRYSHEMTLVQWVQHSASVAAHLLTKTRWLRTGQVLR